MSSSKNYQRYASEWMGLFDAFIDMPTQTRKVECVDEHLARKLQLEWYKARKAFLDDKDMREWYGGVLNSREVTREGCVVVFTHKDRTEIAEAIKASLHKGEE